jgi:hypothetical protein
LAIIIGYEIVAVWLEPTPMQILINNNFFFLSAVIIGMVAGFTIERGLRTDFLQRRLIEAQRAELAVHNAQLDSELQKSLDGLRRQAAEGLRLLTHCHARLNLGVQLCPVGRGLDAARRDAEAGNRLHAPPGELPGDAPGPAAVVARSLVLPGLPRKAHDSILCAAQNAAMVLRQAGSGGP